MEIPGGFLERMRALLKEEYPDFENSLHEPPVSGLRVNSLKISQTTIQTLVKFNLEPVAWCPAGFIIQQRGEAVATSPGKNPYHAAGLYYLQDPSAMAAAEILEPKPGERILDLAAAPGGKSTHIVSLMNNQGLLVANEIHTQRVWELAENLERWGASNTIITQESPTRLAARMEGFFDRVLVDAPCSGEGMFRKSENARQAWSPELVYSCSIRQTAMLSEAARLVRPGGVLVYSTCTFSQEENEAVIAHHLSTHKEFRLEVIDHRAGFSPGVPVWLHEIATGENYTKGILRLWPHKIQGDGHFIARMRRRGSRDLTPRKHGKRDKLPASVLDNYQELCLNIGVSALPVERLLLSGSYLYQSVEESPDLTSLKVIHPGLWLGTYKHSEFNRSRFEPAHALAMALIPGQVSRIIIVDEEQAIEYLKGKPFSHPGSDGWVLVCLDQYPIGWGKRVKGVVKNFYPKGLRWG